MEGSLKVQVSSSQGWNSVTEGLLNNRKESITTNFPVGIIYNTCLLVLHTAQSLNPANAPFAPGVVQE